MKSQTGTCRGRHPTAPPEPLQRSRSCHRGSPATRRVPCRRHMGRGSRRSRGTRQRLGGQRPAGCDLDQNLVGFLDHRLFEFVAEDLQVVEILNPDPDSGELVQAEGSNAALVVPICSLEVSRDRIELAVIRHKTQMRALVESRRLTGRCHGRAACPSLEQPTAGSTTHPRCRSRASRSGRSRRTDETQRKRLITDDDGETGVVAT